MALSTLRNTALLWQLFMLALSFHLSQYPQTSSTPLSSLQSAPSQLQLGVAASAMILTGLQLVLGFVAGSMEPVLAGFNLIAALACTWYWLAPLGELTLLYI
jgi:hypothetical protein